MIASVSSFGTHIFKNEKNTFKWKRMSIDGCPKREGHALKWHPEGTVLATSSISEEGGGVVSLLCYDTNFLKFQGKKLYQCDEGCNISSLLWLGEYLIVAVKPSSELVFYKVIDGNPEDLKKLGAIKSNFCEGSSINLTAYIDGGYFFISAKEHEYIEVWQFRKGEEVDLDWSLAYSVKCGKGVFDVIFVAYTYFEGIITVEKRSVWRLWRLYLGCPQMLKVVFTSERDHNMVHGKRRHYLSNLCCLDITMSGRYVISAGHMDTFVVQSKLKGWLLSQTHEWEICKWKNSDICYRTPRCLKANPKDDISMRVAIGGDSGFIHIWAVYNTNRTSLRIPELERWTDTEFYDKYASLHDIDLEHIKFDEDIMEEDVRYKNDEIEETLEELTALEIDDDDEEEEEEELRAVEIDDEEEEDEEGDGSAGSLVTDRSVLVNMEHIAKEMLNDIEHKQEVSQDRMKVLCDMILQYATIRRSM